MSLEMPSAYPIASLLSTGNNVCKLARFDNHRLVFRIPTAGHGSGRAQCMQVKPNAIIGG